MGGQLSTLCGSDVFQELKNKYGQEFVKLIIAEKAKDAITSRFGQVAVQLEILCNQGKKMTAGIVADKTNYITGLFNQLKAKVQSTIPGGIRMVQQLKGQPIEEIVGFNSLLGVINQIESRAVGQISSKQGVITEELRLRQQNFIQAINDQKPKLPLYDQLPEAMQRQILHKGEEMFLSQVQARQQEMMKQIDNEISLQKVKDIISQLVPRQELNTVTGNAQNSFSNALKALMSGVGGSGGTAGGIVSAIGGMFSKGSLGGNFLGFGNNNAPSNNANASITSMNPNANVGLKSQSTETKQGPGYMMNNLFL